MSSDTQGRAAPRSTRRADARASIDKILTATASCLADNPYVSTSEIARAAGVGRVTLYAHFPSRELLVEATLERVLGRGDEVLERVDLSGEPEQALRALIESSWLLSAQAGAVLEAAQATLPPGRVQELHAKPAQRVDALIRRGQSEGTFRSDLPAEWLVSVLHHLMKGAAADVGTGRLDQDDAARFISDTVVAAFTPARS